uniref:Uncharacterized protein n=1 Tax=mine drainage metagenome TaxID=410659 RepID=E6QCQ2_9ZZZZ
MTMLRVLLFHIANGLPPDSTCTMAAIVEGATMGAHSALIWDSGIIANSVMIQSGYLPIPESGRSARRRSIWSPGSVADVPARRQAG